MVMTKYQETLILLNKIEAKYGSIINCPKDDPNFKKIRGFYPSTGHGGFINSSERTIYKMAREGFSVSEIAELTHINTADVAAYTKPRRIRFKTIFTYRIATPNGQKYYVTSLGKFIRIIFKISRSPVAAQTYLKARGYGVKQGIYRWKFIPNGSYYLPPYLDKPAVKKGMDSYVYEEVE